MKNICKCYFLDFKQFLTTLLSLLQKILLVFQPTCIFLLHKSKLRRYCYLVPCSLIGGNRVKMLLLCLMSIRSMYHSYILNFHAKIESWQKLGGISLVLQFASRWHRFSYEKTATSAGRIFQKIY